MTAKNASKGILSVRTLGAVLTAIFAVLAAASCAPTNSSPGPVPPTQAPPKGAPALGIAVPAPVQSNV